MDKKLYQFNLKDNTVKEVPSMEKPDRNDYMRGGQSIMDSRQRSNFLKDEGLYELHLASLNPDPIKVENKLSSWKDGQILEEGKDIVVMRCCANSCDGFKCKSGNVHLIAYPAADSVANTKQQGKPKVVFYCGSLRVALDAFKRAEYEAVLKWEVALLPCCMFVDIQREYGAESDYKIKADYLHKIKIDISDEVFVLNVGGYIGESTRSEINYAISINKPVKYLEP